MYEALKNQKILIIDDEQTILDIVKEVLKKVGVKPYGVNSPIRGLDMLKTNKFDAIILDRYMPEKDGHDVLKIIKSNPLTKKTPVIMLTGEKDIDQVKMSLKLGAVGYIAKPFTPKDFIAQLSKILSNRMGVNLDFK